MMPIIECHCTECKYIDKNFYCTKKIVELTCEGQCKEGLSIEIDKFYKELKAIDFLKPSLIDWSNKE